MIRSTMRLFPRGKRKEAWVLLCTVCCILGLLQLNNLVYMYPRTTSKLAVEYKHQHEPLQNMNKTVVKLLNNVKVNTTVLNMVARSQHAETLKHHPGLVSGGFPLNFSVEVALQYGHFRPKKGFLTIGIPSVKREKFIYLYDTINSLLNRSSADERATLTIVVMFCDDDQDWNSERALNLSNRYEEHVNSGLIQIITLLPQNYPNFNKLPRTYNDSVERLKWRSKQNIHYAFLFRYCHNISDYYIHLEDDVKAANNYIHDIKMYNRIKKDDWFVIRFSSMGFIGIFFRSSDLLITSDFFLLFYAVQPCDFLINIISNIKLQKKEIRFRPSLFQHHGIISSLKNKKQIIVDKYFKGEKIIRRKKYYNLNPPAELDTTMVVYEEYKPENAYVISDLYFWAISPQKGQTFTLVLKEPHTFSSIVIVGGFPTRKADIIENAEIQVSSSEHCSEWTTLGTLEKGSFDSAKKKVSINHLKDVTCIQIEVTKSQTRWAIISEIALFKGRVIKI